MWADETQYVPISSARPSLIMMRARRLPIMPRGQARKGRTVQRKTVCDARAEEADERLQFDQASPAIFAQAIRQRGRAASREGLIQSWPNPRCTAPNLKASAAILKVPGNTLDHRPKAGLVLPSSRRAVIHEAARGGAGCSEDRKRSRLILLLAAAHHVALINIARVEAGAPAHDVPRAVLKARI